jgi:hypothetical protein
MDPAKAPLLTKNAAATGNILFRKDNVLAKIFLFIMLIYSSESEVD